MEWYGSNLIRRHQHRFRPFFFCEKPLVKNTFFKSFPKKTLRFWISKIRIWIWSDESTPRVYFMDPWSVFEHAQKNSKSVFGFGNPDLDFPEKTHPNIHVSSNGVSKKSNCWLCRVSYDPDDGITDWYLGNRSREPVTSIQREPDQLVWKARDSLAHTVCNPVSNHFSLTLQQLSFLSRKSSEIWPRDYLKSLMWRKTVNFFVFISITKLTNTRSQ